MAVVKETLDMCGSILQIVSKIEDFKEDWFTLPAEYHSQAEILRSKLKFYGEQVKKHGQPADSTMMKSLTKAQSTLQNAESRLIKLVGKVDSDSCCFPGWWLYAKLSMSLCPEKLEKVFKKLIDEIDNIPKTLREEAEIVALMQQADQRRTTSTIIHNNDGLYVPIEKSQSAVMRAIEDLDGPSITLLHGGVGKGKSTLARYIYERYGETGDVEKRNFFEHVILVPCSNTGPDPSTKQFEILEHLSPDSLGTSELQKEKIGSKSRIAKALRDFLNGKTILVILDDVSNAQFLYEMWKAIKGTKTVKYLVTSQSSNVCGSLKNETSLIPMEDPTKDEARMILASLVGLAGKVIPPELQVIAEKMIETTEGNPLALACLASNFTYSRDNQDKRAWQDAYKELCILLDNPEDKIVLGHSEYAPRSLWAAMKMCIDSLETRDAKVILFLLYACKGESIPEEVLRILHAHRKTSSSTFVKSREELLMRELVKYSPRNLAPKIMLAGKDRKDEMQMMSTIWSIRSLVKLYMEHQMANKEEVRSVIGALVGVDKESASESSLQNDPAQDETRVAITLCALYFDAGHIDPAVTHAMAQARKRSNLRDCHDSLTDLRRKAIEPIIWLLDQPEEENWSQTDICCARKVLLKYICEHELDDCNIGHLLKMFDFPFAQLAILMTITHICQLEESPLLEKNNFRFISVLFHILDANKCPSNIKDEASRALKNVCFKANQDHSHFHVATMPSALEILVKLLNKHGNPTLQEHAAAALANLAFSTENSLKLRVPNEGALVGLLNILDKHGNPTLQKATATKATFKNLAFSSENSLKLRIADEKGALASLVKLLDKHGNPTLQEEAARTLRNLAHSTENSLMLRIANEAGALANLVKLLDKDGNPTLQEQATCALNNLAFSTENSLKLRIANEGALAGLVKLLNKEGNPTLQEEVARTLRNLAHSTENSLMLRIANEEGALASLVKLLDKDGTPTLQEEAIVALSNLAASTEISLKLRVANEEGALASFVKLLDKDGNPNLQVQAAGVLRNLAASTENSLKLRIANEEGALASLVKLLDKDGTPTLQEEATLALSNLAASTETSLKLRVANEEGALASFVKLLDKDGNPTLQEYATAALGNLVDMDGVSPSMTEEVKEILKGTEGLLEAVVKLLEESNLPKVQEIATKALIKIDLATCREASLHSEWALRERAIAYIGIGIYAEALQDLDEALEIQKGTSIDLLCYRCFVKVKLGDFGGALEDANESVKVQGNGGSFPLQERGILKCMMGELEGALADLNQGLELDADDYEMLKHRGYVKYLLKDREEEACADAERALKITPPRVSQCNYGSNPCLGVAPIEYLGYKLR